MPLNEEALTKLIGGILAKNLSPLFKWVYSLVVAAIVGTFTFASLWYEIRYGVSDAKRDAAEAHHTATTAMQSVVEIRATVASHTIDIEILKRSK